MKILLTGVHGQVGWELQRTLATVGTVIAPLRHQLDLSQEDQLRDTLRSIKPDLVVNPAAYTAVDKAESEPDLARAINAIAPAIMAQELSTWGGSMVQISTDYVFDGSKQDAWLESDATHPLGVYGATKLEGEQAIINSNIPHLILRTSWVYGLRGSNFLLTMQRLFRERDTLNIVADQFGAPTWSRSIAEATAQILAQRPFNQPELTGIYHLTCSGKTNWHAFANAILQQTMLAANKHVTINAISAHQYPTPAKRPANSVLNNTKLHAAFNLSMPDWQSALDLCLRTE